MPVTRCLSPHVPLPQSRCERLDWYGPRLGERVRVIAWTCTCLATVYELCEAGGQGFIRRTVRFDGRREIRESPRWRTATARVMWTALLSGLVR
ncbi:hypothetical protein ACFOWE_28560 [Planomonospora corallina]|uniref:Uncharacterized protein n=1 Tax=Planomonospora corallina TaxID=1806052 RepID=A0ABV8IH06_9ACTN